MSAGDRPSKAVLVVEDLGQQHLSARSLVAMLRHADWDARLADFGRAQDGECNGSTITALAERLRPRLIIFSILFADRVIEYLALMTALRRAGVRAHLALTGPLPSFTPAELLAACPALDSVLCGEAEASVAALAAGLDDPARWHDVPGLAYREADTLSVRANPWPAAVAELDELPWPQRDIAATSFQGYGFATVQSSRGCYHACAMCLPCAFYRAAPGSHYRQRGISNLVDEIEALYRLGTRLLLFDDEQFLPPGDARQARVEAFAREITHRELKIAFTIKCRPDDVEAGILKRLQAIGLVRVRGRAQSRLRRHRVRLPDHPGSARQRRDGAAQHRGVGDAGPAGSRRRFFLLVVSSVEHAGNDPGRACLPGAGNSAVRHRLQLQRGGSLPRHAAGSPAAGGRPGQRRSWFALLLARRFHPQESDTEQFNMLKALASRLNRENLNVWQEMAAFARQEDILDAPRVNARAGEWAGAVRAACLQAEDALSALMPERPR